MTSLQRLFCFVIITMFVLTAGKPVDAQPWSHRIPVEVRDSNGERTIMVPVNLEEFNNQNVPGSTDCSNPNHKTSLGNPFHHLHIGERAFPIEITNEKGNVIETVTQAMVKEYWNHYIPHKTIHGQLAKYWSCPGGENISFNCWSYAFHGKYYGIWIQDPGPIYNDDYLPESNIPHFYDVVRIRGSNGKDSHVLSVRSVIVDETLSIPSYVMSTAEKFRHSGIYDLHYPDRAGCGYDAFYKKKP